MSDAPLAVFRLRPRDVSAEFFGSCGSGAALIPQVPQRLLRYALPSAVGSHQCPQRNQRVVEGLQRVLISVEQGRIW